MTLSVPHRTSVLRLLPQLQGYYRFRYGGSPAHERIQVMPAAAAAAAAARAVTKTPERFLASNCKRQRGRWRHRRRCC